MIPTAWFQPGVISRKFHVQVFQELEDTLAAALQSARQCRCSFLGYQIFDAKILEESIEMERWSMGESIHFLSITISVWDKDMEPE